MGKADKALDRQTVSVAERAAGWIARLQSEVCSSEDWARFREWRNASAENEATYLSMMAALDTADQYAENPEIMQMRIEAMSLGKDEGQRPAWLLPLAACLVMMVAGAALTLLAPAIYDPSGSGDEVQIASTEPQEGTAQWAGAGSGDLRFKQVYSSAVGQRSSTDLPDGSSIELNTDTVIEVDFSAGQRNLTLVRGEAVFEVAHDASRPFIVHAGDETITALGTIFSVRRTGDSMVVALVEGSVEVEKRAPDGSAKPAVGVRLTPGQQARSGGAESRFQVTKVNIDRALSWRTGRLIFDNDRLADAIEEVNRYSTRKLVLDRPALADLRVSGAFSTGSAEKFATAISVALPVIVEPGDHGTDLVVKPDPARASAR